MTWLRPESYGDTAGCDQHRRRGGNRVRCAFTWKKAGVVQIAGNFPLFFW